MSRLRYNNEAGVLGANLTSGGTAITFQSPPNFATLESGDYIVLALDAELPSYEIVWLTAYAAGSLNGTITRAAEDADNWPAVAHASSGTWVCAPTVEDFTTIPTIVNVTDDQYGALGDGVTLADGNSSGTTFTSATASFTSADVGKVIVMSGGGAVWSPSSANQAFATTIASINSSTSVNLTAPPTNAVTNVGFTYGTDDTTAINAAITAAALNGSTVFFQASIYMVTSTIVVPGGVLLQGTAMEYGGQVNSSPVLGSVLVGAGSGLTTTGHAVVQLGQDTSTAPGHASAAMEHMTIDGYVLADSALITIGPRTRTQFCQIWRGINWGARLDGQNTRFFDNVVGQANTGYCIWSHNFDNKVMRNDVRQFYYAGIHVDAVTSGSASDHLISENHIYSSTSGSSSAIPAYDVLVECSFSTQGVTITNNIFDSCDGPQLCIKPSAGNRFGPINVVGNQFFQITGSPSDLYPAVRLDVSAAGSTIRGFCFTGNTVFPSFTTSSNYTSMVEAYGAGDIFNTVITGNSINGVQTTGTAALPFFGSAGGATNWVPDYGFGNVMEDSAFNNLVSGCQFRSVFSPTTANDVSQGYVVGSLWENIATSPHKVFMCTDNTASAAVWALQITSAQIGGPFNPTTTGATTSTGYVGGTTSGPPTTGTFSQGQWIMGQDGFLWMCRSGGTPGTWIARSTPSLITAAASPRPATTKFLTPLYSTTGNSGGPWTLGQVYFLPLDVAVDTAYTGIGCSYTVAAIGGTTPLIHMGLYADSLNLRMNPTGTTTIVTQTTPGGFNTEVTTDPTGATGDQVVNWATPQSLAAGRYWVAWMLTSGSALGTNPTMVQIYPLAQYGADTLGDTGARGALAQTAAGNAANLPTVGTPTKTSVVTPMVGLQVQ